MSRASSVEYIVDEFSTLSDVDQREVYIRIKQVYEQTSEREKLEYKGSQQILWKDILFGLLPNRYIQTYQEIWRLESILGSDVVLKSLRKHSVLDANFVENLFGQSSYYFYVNHLGTYLLSDNNELFEHEFGPLTQLTALEAVQRYGLSLLEESKEKGYVRV